MPRAQRSNRLSDDQIFNLAAAYERQAEIEGRAKKEKKTISDSIASELGDRGVKSLTASDGTTVTRVQAENVVIDDKGLWADLKPRQRRKAFRASLTISELPAADQKALMELLRERGLTKNVRWTLDASMLNNAVQNDEIDAEIVSNHSEIVKNAPYIKVSHGTGE